MDNDLRISVVLPCLNESGSIARCIREIHDALRTTLFSYEVVVCDNGSTDGSASLAEAAGARVVHEPRRGYGAAYLAGIRAARGHYIILADADGTYDFAKIPAFVEALAAGHDLVMGDRFAGDMEAGAMPWLHRYVGNPVLSALLRAWFDVRVRDAHCGMRAIQRPAYEKLNLKTTGMEFASEMVIRAGREGLAIAEVPLDYRRRIGDSKLRTWRDGWRHLRFMLLFAPSVVFFWPGCIMLLIGLSILIPMTFGPLSLAGLVLDVHPMFGASLLTVLGVQVMILGVCTKLFAVRNGFEPVSSFVRWWYRNATLERLLLLGLFVAFAGLFISGNIVFDWIKSGFGALSAIRPFVLSFTLVIVGWQIMFAAFFTSLLTLHEQDH